MFILYPCESHSFTFFLFWKTSFIAISIVLRGVSQTMTMSYDFIYVCNPENRIKKQTKQNQAHRYRRHFDGYGIGGLGNGHGGRGLRGINW